MKEEWELGRDEIQNVRGAGSLASLVIVTGLVPRDLGSHGAPVVLS